METAPSALIPVDRHAGMRLGGFRHILIGKLADEVSRRPSRSPGKNCACGLAAPRMRFAVCPNNLGIVGWSASLTPPGRAGTTSTLVAALPAVTVIGWFDRSPAPR